MAVRTTEAEVREILPSSTTLTTTQVDHAITAASCVVDQVALGCASHLTADCLKEVETYLAAHFSAVTENTLTLSSETDACVGARVVYGFKFGDGVKGTPFGQMANTLSGGCLMEQDKQPISFNSIGIHGNDSACA